MSSVLSHSVWSESIMRELPPWWYKAELSQPNNALHVALCRSNHNRRSSPAHIACSHLHHA